MTCNSSVTILRTTTPSHQGAPTRKLTPVELMVIATDSLVGIYTFLRDAHINTHQLRNWILVCWISSVIFVEVLIQSVSSFF